MRLKALIQYNCIPHYRAPIFELLSANRDVEFAIVADDNPDTPFLKTVSRNSDRQIRHIHARNYLIRIPGLTTLYWQPKALSVCIQRRPNVIIALGSPYSSTAWSLVVLGRLLRIPVLLWGHGLLGDESGPKWWLRKSLYKLAKGQLLYGDYAKELLIRKGFGSETLHVVYNSLDYDGQLKVIKQLTRQEIANLRGELGVKDRQRLVVFTGRLQPVKRLDMLVDAVGRLYKRGHILHVALVGEGVEHSRLETLACECGIAGNVHFLGANYDEVYLGTLLAAADLCVIPSGAGLSIMHSLVFGTPVLLHDRVECHFPEWEAVEEGVTGFFYRYGDTEDLADRLEFALFPEPKKPHMEEACRRVIRERYNPHRQVDIFVEAVRQAASSGR